MSEEIGRSGIRVNAIVPGYITTAMTEGMSKFSKNCDESTSAIYYTYKRKRRQTPINGARIRRFQSTQISPVTEGLALKQAA